MVKEVVSRVANTFFIFDNGTVKACGRNAYGQLGLGDDVNHNVPTLIPSVVEVKQVAANASTFFIFDNGTVKACGWNANGDLGLGDNVNRNVPTLIPNLTGVNQITGKNSTFFLLENGTVKACGANNNGQLGLGDKVSRNVPTLISGVVEVKQVISWAGLTGNDCTFFLLEDGTVKGCGVNTNGQLGLGDNVNRNVPTLIPNLTGVNQIITSDATNNNFALFLLEDGTVKACGFSYNGCIGLGEDPKSILVPTLIPGAIGVKQVIVGLHATFFLLENGTVKACGVNDNGQLGLGDNVGRGSLTLIPSLTGIKRIEAYVTSTFFLLEDGTVKGCGVNTNRQLGLGDNVNRNVPTLIPGLIEQSIISTTYLYLKNAEVYSEQNNALVKVSDNYQALTNKQKKALFEAASSEIATSEKLSVLDKFKILRYSTDNNQVSYTATAIPHKSKIIPNELITLNTSGGIKKVSLDAQGVCKVFITTDLATYKSFDPVARAWTATDVGINAADLASIAQTEWDALLQGGKQIAFAYELDMESTSDTAQFADLTIAFYGSGSGSGDSWDMAVPGTDYTYGYPANNLLQVSIKRNGDYKINYPE